MQHHRSWDDAAVDASPAATRNASKAPTRAASSPLPPTYKCPRSPRKLPAQSSVVHSYTPPEPHSPSARSNYSNYSDSVVASGSRQRCDNPPRSPKITTTSYANDRCAEGAGASAGYYQMPTARSRSPKGLTSQRSPQSPCRFVFDAIGADQTLKQVDYEPNARDDAHSAAMGDEKQQQHGKKSIRTMPAKADNVARIYCADKGATADSIAKCNEWEMPLVAGCSGSGGYFRKRDSCVTDSTQLSVESNETNNSGAATTTTSFSYSDRSKPASLANDSSRNGEAMMKRRHAINITANPGYQVLHSSHSTLDRTCSDSVVSLRYRKSTSDLTKDSEESNKPMPDAAQSAHKPRRRGSSKGGLAYLASRRSSRESMKSACSNASIFSNDDIGPLASFQASTRGKQRRTSNFLELPVPDHIRPRVCSLPDRPYNPRVSEDLYRLRHFSISKGNVVNCGDSIISRRSRSNTSVNSTNSRASERSPFDGSCCGGGYANVDSLPASPDDSEEIEPPPPPRYRVVMLGDAGVGKTALVNQFMTSEYMHTYDASLDDEFGEKTVSILLDDEESELVFIDHPSVEMSVENCLSTYEPHGCVVVFSVVDKLSFRVAEEIMNYLWQENYTKDKAVILVGNKADLARARVVLLQDGKALATSRDSKFIETSSGIQHNVDELLVGILKQMRLKESREKKTTSSKLKTSRTHISLHLAKEIFQKICLSDISKSKSCENLHVL